MCDYPLEPGKTLNSRTPKKSDFLSPSVSASASSRQKGESLMSFSPDHVRSSTGLNSVKPKQKQATPPPPILCTVYYFTYRPGFLFLGGCSLGHCCFYFLFSFPFFLCLSVAFIASQSLIQRDLKCQSSGAYSVLCH